MRPTPLRSSTTSVARTGAVGQRAGVARGDRAVFPIEDRPQRSELLEARIAANVVVGGHRMTIEIDRRDLLRETAIVPRRGGPLVAAKRPRVLRLTRDA